MTHRVMVNSSPESTLNITIFFFSYFSVPFSESPSHPPVKLTVNVKVGIVQYSYITGSPAKMPAASVATT